MAKNRKTASQAAEQFKSRVGQSAARYVAGVSAPGVDWAGAATSPEAVNRRNTGLRAAMDNGTIDAGIQKAGNSKWQQNAKVKGGATWAPQTQAATGRYQAGMATVEGWWGAADNAANQAGDGSTYASREARGAAFRKVIHDNARAAKGLPPD